MCLWLLDWPVKWVADESSDWHNNNAWETEGQYAAAFQWPCTTDRCRICRTGTLHSHRFDKTSAACSIQCC